MAALYVLLGIAAALLILAVRPALSARLRPVQVALCLLGLATALLWPGDGIVAGPFPAPAFASDGLSRVVLAALFLGGACGTTGPAVLATLVLATLAADALSLFLLLAAASLARPGWLRRGPPLLALATALLLLAWHGALPDPQFAAIRAIPPEGLRAALLLLAALAAAITLPGILPAIPGLLMSVLLLARLLLDLPGPVTPGWWGVPVLVAAMAGAIVMARRAAAADDLAAAADAAGCTTLSLAAAAVAVALLARGADLGPLAALAIEAALLMLLATALWCGLMQLATAAIQASAGTTSLVRLGGVLRRVPVTGIALLLALLSMAALPPSLGFAPFWLLVQALSGVGRLGGTALLALSAGSVAALGLTMALLAAAALRLAGSTLLAAPRSAKAAAMTEPPLPARLGLGTMAAALCLAGLCPGAVVLAVQPGVRQLTGAAAEGAGPLLLATGADSPGYAAAILAGLLAAGIAAAAYACRGAVVITPAWRGGLAEDGAARANIHRLLLWPGWRASLQSSLRRIPPAVPSRLALSALALALAAALGWAAR